MVELNAVELALLAALRRGGQPARDQFFRMLYPHIDELRKLPRPYDGPPLNPRDEKVIVAFRTLWPELKAATLYVAIDSAPAPVRGVETVESLERKRAEAERRASQTPEQKLARALTGKARGWYW